MKLQVIKGINNSTIINSDNVELLYNEGKKIRIVVLGDIAEDNNRLRYDIGKYISLLNFTYLIVVGNKAQEYIKGAISMGINRNLLYYFKTVSDLLPYIEKFIINNSEVIFIGNHIDFNPVISKITLN